MTDKSMATAEQMAMNDSCSLDDPGQDYVECPNCACGRIYAVECDCCGWSEGTPLRDWSRRRRRIAQAHLKGTDHG